MKKILLLLLLLFPFSTYAYVQEEIEDQTTKYTYSSGTTTIRFEARSDHIVIAPQGGVGYGCGNGNNTGNGMSCGLVFKMCKIGGNTDNPRVTSVIPFYSLQGDSSDTITYSTNVQCRVKLDGNSYDGHLLYIHFDNITSQFIILNNTREYYRWAANVTITGSSNGFYALNAYTADVIPDYIVSAYDNWLITKNDTTVINQNTQIINGQQQIDDSINDSSLDNENDSLIDDFLDSLDEEDYGFQDIITAPLDLFLATTNTCVPVNMNIIGANTTLPCGTDIFWNKAEIAPLTVFWNIMFGGAAIYFNALILFNTIKNATDPLADSVATIRAPKIKPSKKRGVK